MWRSWRRKSTPDSRSTVSDGRGRIAPAALTLISLAGLAIAGCAGGERIRRAILPPDPQQAMTTAMNADAPAGERRTALRDVAESRSATATWAVDGYLQIIQTERDAQLRSIALRALPASGDSRALPTLMNVAKESPDARSAGPGAANDDLCRWDAVLGIEKMSRAGAIPPDQQDAAVAVLAEALRRDPSRHVRTAAATALGTFQRPAAVDALISGLRDPHFAVTHASDSALVALTGQNFHCDPASWEQWRNANRDALFANAGRVPEDRRAGYGSEWEERQRSLKATFRSFLWQPKRKSPAAPASPADSSPAAASNEPKPAPAAPGMAPSTSTMTPAGSTGAASSPRPATGAMEPVPSAGRVP
jgi:hypothetical protein